MPDNRTVTECSHETCPKCGERIFHVRPEPERWRQRADIVLEHVRQAGTATAEELRARGAFKQVGGALRDLLRQRRIEKLPPRDGERYPCYRVAAHG
jgi:hypothetical protein